MFDHEVDAQNFEVDMKTNEEVLKGKNTTENENGEQKYYRGGGQTICTFREIFMHLMHFH